MNILPIRNAKLDAPSASINALRTVTVNDMQPKCYCSHSKQIASKLTTIAYRLLIDLPTANSISSIQ